MGDSLAALVLAAGAGSRLSPLTLERPKPLCPVGDRTLIDHALDRVSSLTDAVAVNIHHGHQRLEAHLGDRAHLSVEEQAGLGTAGAIVEIIDWLEDRPLVVVNADTMSDVDVAAAAEGWDRERVAVLVLGSDELDPRSAVVGSLLPGDASRRLPRGPSGLYEACWRPAQEAGRLQVIRVEGRFHDCGTPARYLAANLEWSGGASVVADDGEVAGQVIRSVVWPGGVVASGERLVDGIRTGAGRTVLVR